MASAINFSLFYRRDISDKLDFVKVSGKYDIRLKYSFKSFDAVSGKHWTSFIDNVHDLLSAAEAS